MAKCKWCGSEFDKKHNRQVYCTDYCKIESRREQKLKDNFRRNNLNKNQGIFTYSQYKNNLGTTSMSIHINENPKREHDIIKNQMKMVGIKSSTFF